MTNNDEEEQLEIDDDSNSKSPAGHSSGSSSGDQIGSEDSEDDDEPNKGEVKKDEDEAHEEMRNFAEQNGFKLEFEKNKKEEDDIMVLYEKAKNFKITKEILDQ